MNINLSSRSCISGPPCTLSNLKQEVNLSHNANVHRTDIFVAEESASDSSEDVRFKIMQQFLFHVWAIKTLSHALVTASFYAAVVDL